MVYFPPRDQRLIASWRRFIDEQVRALGIIVPRCTAITRDVAQSILREKKNGWSADSGSKSFFGAYYSGLIVSIGIKRLAGSRHPRIYRLLLQLRPTRSADARRVQDLIKTNPMSAAISGQLTDPPPRLGGAVTFMDTVATFDVVPRLSCTEY
jgi:hypothetical protein